MPELPNLPPAEAERVRRRALQLPYFVAGINFIGWVLAGLIWGVAFPLATGTFSAYDSLRQIFGTTVIAGGVTVAFIFFVIEHLSRQRLHRVFPEGDLSAVRGVPRLTVRVRLLAIFLMVGVVPLAVLGILTYTRALALLGAGPTTAADRRRHAGDHPLPARGRRCRRGRPLHLRGQQRGRSPAGRGGRRWPAWSTATSTATPRW